MITELLYSLNNWLVFLLRLNPIFALLLISIVTVTFSTLIYKRFSNQTEIKRLKGLVKDLNKEAKTHMDDKDKVLSIQNDILKYNMDLMKLTMRPSFYTIIPLMFIFIWLSLVYAQIPIMPDSQFSVNVIDYTNLNTTYDIITDSYSNFELLNYTYDDETATFVYKSPSTIGKYNYDLNGETHSLIVSNHPVYFEKKLALEDSDIEINTEKQIILNLFGWKLGYIGTYIILSIFINTLVRKLLDVH